jgi:hypothetical protein
MDKFPEPSDEEVFFVAYPLQSWYTPNICILFLLKEYEVCAYL